jgi:hypothetical protein
MGKRCDLALLGFVTVSLVFPAPAFAGRHCLYQGKIFRQGDVTCIRVDGRTRLARCEMLLNNATWNFFQDGCPTALMTPIRDRDGPCPGSAGTLAAIEESDVDATHAIVH